MEHKISDKEAKAIADQIDRFVKIELAAVKFLAERGHSQDCKAVIHGGSVSGQCTCGLFELEAALKITAPFREFRSTKEVPKNG